jgi:hypothetical protein
MEILEGMGFARWRRKSSMSLMLERQFASIASGPLVPCARIRISAFASLGMAFLKLSCVQSPPNLRSSRLRILSPCSCLIRAWP